MHKKGLSKHLSHSVAPVFMIAATTFCSSCKTPQEVHDFVAEKMATGIVTLPPNLKRGTMAAQTYEYWMHSVAAVSLCTDRNNFESGDFNKRAAAQNNTSEGMLSQEIIEYVTGLPTANVDPAATKSIDMVADNYEKMDSYHDAVQNLQIGLSSKWGSALLGAMGDIDFTDDIDVGGTMGKIVSNADANDVKNIKSAVDGYAKMQKLGHSTHINLGRARRELTERYHADFPEIPLNSGLSQTAIFPGTSKLA